MTKSFLVIMSSIMIPIGFAFYIAGHRKRNSIDVPLLSNYAKMFIGGVLIIFGLVFLTSTMVFK
jgi:hypothetical protein